jgi:hypothetical protein
MALEEYAMRVQIGIAGLVLALAVGASAAEVAIRTLARGSQSGVKKAERVVAKTPAEWATLWKRHAGEAQAAEAPKVDWSKEMVLGAFLGTRNTGGYALQITGAKEEAGKLVVQVEAKTPKPGSFVTQTLTSPFHLVAVPKSSLPVIWSVSPAR